MPDQDGKEECCAREDYCTRADAEVLKPFMVSAEHRHDNKKLNQDHERHDRPRNKRRHQAPFDGDAVVELGMQLTCYGAGSAKIGIVTVGAIAEKCLLNIPVFQNEIWIYPGTAAGSIEPYAAKSGVR